MRTKLMALLFVISICKNSLAQLHLGDAVVTKYSYLSSDRCVEIYDVGITSSAPLGDNWGISPTWTTNVFHQNWTRAILGPVFGLAINSTDPDHPIYVSNTQIFPQDIFITYPNGLKNYPDPSPAGVVLIWKLNPITGAYDPLVESTLTQTLSGSPTNKIFNRGTGIGNICYDKIHDRIFATNMEDGMIYRIEAATGNVISRYDPFGSYSYDGTNAPKFPDLGERLWGIGYANDKVYFSRWWEDSGNQSSVEDNEIWTVNIDPASGEFSNVGGSFPNYSGSGAQRIIIISSIVPTPPDISYSNPVSDIEFSQDGRRMLLAERTMAGPYAGFNPDPFSDPWSHRARILRYDFFNGFGWNQSPKNYFVGNTTVTLVTPGFYSTNCAGGTDFGYSFVDTLPGTPDTCETWVWATGDALENDQFPGGAISPEWIYGLAGIPIGGNSLVNVNSTSIYQDIFGNISSSGPNNKSLPGDVDIFRDVCCFIVAELNADPVKDSFCVGNALELHGTGGYWGKIIKDGVATDSFYMPPDGYNETIAFGSGDVGNHTFCLIVYSDNPDSNASWCSDIACVNIVVLECGCDTIQAQLNFIPDKDSFCIGQTIITTYSGGSWGKTITNGTENSFFPITQDGASDTVFVESAYIGDYTVCFVAYSANPDSGQIWCTDTICRIVTVAECQCDSLKARMTDIDTLCLGDSINVQLSGGSWYQTIYDGVAGNIKPMPVGGITFNQNVTQPSSGIHNLCLVVYSSNPELVSNWCSDTTCNTIVVQDCCDSLHAQIEVIPDLDSVCVGYIISWSVDGGNWGRLFDHNSQSDVFEIPSGGAIITDVVDPGYVGLFTKCLVVYSDNPDSTEYWCSDTACLTISVYNCVCDTPDANLTIIPDQDTFCVNDSVVFHSTSHGWAKIFKNGVQVANILIPPSGIVSVQPIGANDIGYNQICLIVYSANPDSTEDWCSDTACVNAFVQNCCDSTIAFLTVSDDTVCVGDTVHFYVSGGKWGRTIDNDITDEFFPMPPGGINFPFPMEPDDIGYHHYCLVVYSMHPDSAEFFCSDTTCVDGFVQDCCDSLGAYIFLSGDTFCVGERVLISFGGMGWGRIIDNGLPNDEVFPIPSEGFIDSVVLGMEDTGAHELCLIVYSDNPDSTEYWCSDTVCAQGVVQLCNCDSLQAYFEVSEDTVCIGDSVTVYVGGGNWGRFINNGVPGNDIFPIPFSGLVTTYPVKPTAVGVYDYCLVVYSDNPDSAFGFCSDTICINGVVENCICDSVEAIIDISNDTLCAGDSLIFHVNGGNWGKIIIDGVDDADVNMMPASGIIFSFHIEPGDLGTHTLCLIVFSSNPEFSTEWCSDTTCITVVVEPCKCDSLLINAELAYNPPVDMKYEFYNSGVKATFINWLVDGVKVGQTPGDVPFLHELPPGNHEVCMQAAYIFPGENGFNICCYDIDCDSIRVDSCEYWKATDGISYDVDPSDYHDVTFHFSGFGGDLVYTLTVIWNFGDGTTEVNDGTPITHHYNDDIIYEPCAIIVWSKFGEWTPEDPSVCCCVDTICLDLEVSPCNAITYSIWIYQTSGATTTFVAEPTVPAIISGATYNWYVDGVLSGSGSSKYFDHIGTGIEELCATINYITIFDEGLDTCTTEVCEEFDFGNEEPGGLMRYFPNPTNGSLTLEVDALEKQAALVELRNYIGQPILSQKYEGLRGGMNQLYLSMNELQNGLYILKVSIGDKIKVVKVVKN